LTNARGVILDANESACALLGFARDEIVYTNVIKLLHGDEVKKLVRRRESTSLWGAPDGERQMVRKDGEVIVTEGRGCLIHKNKQMFVFRDLTRQRRAEELLSETRKRMLDILDSMSDSFIVLDTEWRFKYINKRAAELSGVVPEDILNESIWDRSPRLRGTPFEVNYRKAMDERRSVLFEAETPEGRWIEVRVYPTVEGLTIYGSDVTERKRAEERLLFALESAKIMILEWTDEHGENRLGPDSDGKPRTAANGLNGSLQSIHPEDRARVADERQRATEKGGDSTLEFRIVRPDGSHSWVSDRVRVFHGVGGEVTRITDVFLDITERKRCEEAKKRLEEDKRCLESDKRCLEEDKRRLEADKRRLEEDKKHLEDEKRRLEERLEDAKKRLEDELKRAPVRIALSAAPLDGASDEPAPVIQAPVIPADFS
jgi:PAS domain S-box-containing protein